MTEVTSRNEIILIFIAERAFQAFITPTSEGNVALAYTDGAGSIEKLEASRLGACSLRMLQLVAIRPLGEVRSTSADLMSVIFYRGGQ